MSDLPRDPLGSPPTGILYLPPRPRRRRTLARILFKPRLSAIDMLTWWPLSATVGELWGWLAGVAVLIPVAAAVVWIEDMLLGKERE